MSQRDDCGVTEEQIVDLLLHGGESAEARRAERHVRECRACAERLQAWRGLLAERSDEERLSPSPAVWRRLAGSLRWSAPLRQLFRLPQRCSRTVLAAGAGALMLGGLFIGALDGIKERLHAPAADSVAIRTNDEIMAHMDIRLQGRTAQYPVQPLGTAGVRGVAWVNDEAEELLLFVEGLPSVPGQDYLVWSVRDDNRVTLGTMRLAAGKAHLYYRGGELHDATSISVSREQSGGNRGPGDLAASDVAAVKLK